MKLTTHLLSGAGNTFHICFGEAFHFAAKEQLRDSMRAVAKKICRETPADGFIFLETISGQEAKTANNFCWYFFNNDGSDAEMCGNATRCIGFFLQNIIENKLSPWALETVRGVVKIEIADEKLYKITMPEIAKKESALGFYCDTGVPHLVIETTNANIFGELTTELKAHSKKLRFHEEFGASGTNVTYVFLGSEINKIKAISYERGVENFTAACGTGAMAAAFYNLAKRGIEQTQVEMPGGSLMMNLTNLAAPTMTGPAVFLGSYEHDIKI